MNDTAVRCQNREVTEPQRDGGPPQAVDEVLLEATPILFKPHPSVLWTATLSKGEGNLYSIPHHGEKLQQGTQIHKNMEHGVHPLPLAAKAVENGTDCIGNAAKEQQ